MKKFTVKDFFERFPNDDACLEHVMEVRFGMRHSCQKCGVESTFHKLANRKAYSCAQCGNNLYPCAGTIFEDSRTSLQTWFYAIFLFVNTRHGVSGKEIQRATGVTYKTAWRIGQHIRLLMTKTDGFEMLQGHIEADETYVGGKRRGVGGGYTKDRTIVAGMKQRDGRTVTEVVQNVKKTTLRDVVNRNVEKGSIVSTDELRSYNLLTEDGYIHGAVNHGKKQWARDGKKTGVRHHTNSVEGFWNLFKSSVKSTHVHVSAKYMQRYLNEFTFRANHREMGNAMFDLLIGAV